MNPAMTPTDDRLIVALDVPNILDGLDLAARLGDAVSFYKIGLGMLTGGGLALANELKQDHGKRIFLDLKLFDIGATIEAAVRGLAQFDLDFLPVHGDPQVVRAAREGAGGSGLNILAVTVLTSLDKSDLEATGVNSEPADQVLRLAVLARQSGLDGCICSPHEIAALRRECGPDFVLMVPGIRPVGSATNDQKRAMTPRQAVDLGATHLVVGRPIYQAADPRSAAEAIAREAGVNDL